MHAVFNHMSVCLVAAALMGNATADEGRDRASREATRVPVNFQSETKGNSDFSKFNVYTVPANKRLVVETVSVSIIYFGLIPPTKSPQVEILYTAKCEELP